MKNVLVLCTGNSCRSQIAEGFLRKYLNDSYTVYSAGLESHGVNPNAIRAMNEIGIDISTHTSNTIEELTENDYEFVITVCDNARENCPYYPSKTKLIHQTFTDPTGLEGSEDEKKESFRVCRDAIGFFCEDFANQHNTD